MMRGLSIPKAAKRNQEDEDKTSSRPHSPDIRIKNVRVATDIQKKTIVQDGKNAK